MGCEFAFGYYAGLLLGQAEPLDGGAIRGVVAACWLCGELEGGAMCRVLVSCWRRGVLEEFWEEFQRF